MWPLNFQLERLHNHGKFWLSRSMSESEKDASALSSEAKAKIAEHIEKQAPNFRCTACGNDKMILADHLVSLAITAPNGGVRLGGRHYPMAPVICSICGHSSLFAAGPLGVLVRNKTAEKTEPADG